MASVGDAWHRAANVAMMMHALAYSIARIVLALFATGKIYDKIEIILSRLTVNQTSAVGGMNGKMITAQCRPFLENCYSVCAAAASDFDNTMIPSDCCSGLKGI